MWEAVAYVAVVAHFAFLALGILGGFAAWRWPWLIWFQIAAASWLALVVAAGLPCPLTWLQNEARVHAGQPPLNGGFLANYVAGVFYPIGHEGIARVVAALVVLSSWAGLAVIRRRRRQAGNRSRSRRSSPDPAARA